MAGLTRAVGHHDRRHARRRAGEDQREPAGAGVPDVDLTAVDERLADLGPAEVGVEVDPDELEKGGYRTTVARAKAVLDEYGYTVPFFAEIYESFRHDLTEQVRDLLDDEIGGVLAPDPDEAELRTRVDAHLSVPPNTAIGDLEAFTAFLREAIEKDLKMEPFLEDRIIDRGPDQPPLRMPVTDAVRYRSSDLADFDTLHMLILDRAARVPSGVLRAMMLFSDDYVYEYPEVLSLLYTRLMLDATPDDALVELDGSMCTR